MKTFSYINTGGLNEGKNSLKPIMDVALSGKSDVVILAEVDLTADRDLLNIEFTKRGYIVFLHCVEKLYLKDSRGVIGLQRIDANVEIVTKSCFCRLWHGSIGELDILAIHLPHNPKQYAPDTSRSKDHFKCYNEKISSLVKNFNPDVVIGDFNKKPSPFKGYINIGLKPGILAPSRTAKPKGKGSKPSIIDHCLVLKDKADKFNFAYVSKFGSWDVTTHCPPHLPEHCRMDLQW